MLRILFYLSILLFLLFGGLRGVEVTSYCSGVQV